MKLRNLIIIATILLFSYSITTAQVIIIKSNSIPIENDSIVKFVLPEIRGNIQWQKSIDSINWINLETEINDTLYVESNIEALYRAEITEGNCIPLYSDTASIVFTKPTVNTQSVLSIQQFTATFKGNLISNGGSELSNVGFFLSENKDSITDGIKIYLDENADTFSYTVSYLKPSSNYFICAFAENSKGTSLGNIESFKTKEFEYIIFDLREDTTYGWDALVVANDESNYYVKFVNQKPVSVYFTPDINKDGFSIFFGNNGLPSKMVVDSFIVLFDNYRDNFFDIAIIQPGGEINIFRNVQNNLIISDLKSVKNINEIDWLPFAIKTTSNLIGVTTCSLAILSGVATIPAILACGPILVNMIAQLIPEDVEIHGLPVGEVLEFLSGKAGGVIGIIECAAKQNIQLCLLTLADIYLNLELELIEYISYENQVPIAQVMLYLPSITTNSISNITQTTATGGGNVTSDGGASVTARGVCWSTLPNPTTTNSKTTNGTGTGSFISNMSGLTANTPYYVRAYATNSIGTAYGSPVTFTTSSAGNLTGTFTDSRDGKAYKTVKIGEQVWMAENLAYDAGNNCWAYENDGKNTATYGRLYSLNAAKNACPSGWHLPSDNEWEQLAIYINEIKGPYSKAGDGDDWKELGKHLKTATGWNENGNGTNDFGFSALPGGHRTYGGKFEDIGYNGYWWSSDGNIRSLSFYFSYFLRGLENADAGLSIRCIKGEQQESEIKIGNFYQGGIIFYIDNTGQHGLVAAQTDQSTGIKWYNGIYKTTGASGTAVGTGKSNTNAIISVLGIGDYAASICSQLTLNGYNDWFLPSKEELNLLFQLSTEGKLNDYDYWSSTESGGTGFGSGAWYSSKYYSSYGTEYFSARVRAIRAF